VKAFVRYNSRNSWGWLEEAACRDSIDVVAGDIRDYDSVDGAMKGCDTVFHLAALIGIPYSYVSPLAYIKTNVEGTYNVLQAARVHKLQNILITSTSETYGTAQYVPIDEQHPAVGQSPYAATKIGADQIALSYYRSFDLPVKVVRPFNTYGPRQSARAVIPAITIQLLSGGKTIKLGNVHPTRDLTYVKDTVSGFMEIAESDELFGEATNIGMNQEISISDLAELICEVTGSKTQVKLEEQRVRPDRSEVERLWCDNGKLVSKTAWHPEYDLKKGISETVEWIKTHMSLYKSGVYNV
jgi:NAD dependent epimerase/dehydratase